MVAVKLPLVVWLTLGESVTTVVVVSEGVAVVVTVAVSVVDGVAVVVRIVDGIGVAVLVGFTVTGSLAPQALNTPTTATLSKVCDASLFIVISL